MYDTHMANAEAIDPNTDFDAALRQMTVAVREARANLDRLAARRSEMAQAARLAGMSASMIAAACEISRGRAFQIIHLHDDPHPSPAEVQVAASALDAAIEAHELETV